MQFTIIGTQMFGETYVKYFTGEVKRGGVETFTK